MEAVEMRPQARSIGFSKRAWSLRYMTEIARLHVHPFEFIFVLLQSLNDSRE
jgi:hypothetical protein